MIENRSLSTINILTLSEQNLRIRAFWIFTVALCMAVGAQIEIPNQPVPFTMQTFFVLLGGALLGKRDGAISMGMYLILGIIGLPVFSGGASGLAKIIGPTGGYLLSFPIAAFIVGYLTGLRNEYWWMLISMFVGSFIIFSLGAIHLNYVYLHSWINSFYAGFLIFSWWDGVKIVSAATIAYSYSWKLRK